MKTSRLTDKHFKSKNVQRIHQQINYSYHFFLNRGYNLFFYVWLAISGFATYTYPPPFWRSIAFCLQTPAILFWMFLIFILGHAIIDFLYSCLPLFYRPPSSNGDEIILINPDGNPEMCEVFQYPAIQGLYGYRLPNAGDIEKIEKFMKSA